MVIGRILKIAPLEGGSGVCFKLLDKHIDLPGILGAKCR